MLPREQRAHRRAGLLIGVLLVVAPITAAIWVARHDAPSTEQRGPAGPVPAGLARFYGQALTWEHCDDYARNERDRSWLDARAPRCARLIVPLDYAKPQGDTITISVVRRKALDQERRVGSLVVGMGGPGMPGLANTAGLADSLRDMALAQRFDIVGFDARGIGTSEPAIRCLTDAERDEWRASEGVMGYTSTDDATTGARRRDFAAKCAARTGKGAAMLASVGTRDVARDLDVLRSALGEEKLNFLGYSYSTRLGATYAHLFPKNVRAMVLDGAFGPGKAQPSGARGQQQPPPSRSFQLEFEEFTRWCKERERCSVGSGPLTDLLRPLLTLPAQARDGR